MYCSRCGTALPDDSDFCTSCGAKILKEVSIPEATETKPKIKLDGKKKTLAIVAVCIVFALGVWIIISQISKSNLHKELMRDWSRVESSGGSYYTLELDFSEDEIEYIFDSFFMMILSLPLIIKLFPEIKLKSMPKILSTQLSSTMIKQ